MHGPEVKYRPLTLGLSDLQACLELSRCDQPKQVELDSCQKNQKACMSAMSHGHRAKASPRVKKMSWLAKQRDRHCACRQNRVVQEAAKLKVTPQI